MNADRDKLVKEIFADALEKANAVERAAYLTQACGNDVQLRQQVEALLQADEKAGGFLEEPAAASPGGTIVVSTPLTEKPGDRIGHFKLLQQIGEGGCGVVYMAEQEQPIRRRVALKVIKLGMDTKAVIARFEAERQALALMDHPNIAKVLDAGATETGRPYFVMELVRGIKITEYCDQNNLSTDERLDLFVQICHAIQHAHQKGIIHRDIKPSNILVTVHDGKPLPKIIDFGIAKATSGQVLTDKTLFTAFEQFIGTPAYMSPEQAEMSTLDIDTRSDIYALGVLLYELLTGRTPLDQEELLAAGLSEMRRIIREKEPLRPSTRISTLEATDQTTVAKRRHSEPPQLIHLVRGDLDWIVMKCLEKDRTRRYETANGLAHDILCHLNNEPVLARPPSKLYRFEKAFRRHKLGFAAGTAIVAALILGVIGTTLGLIRAEKQTRMAEAERQEQSRLKDIAVKSLDSEKEQRARAEAERHRAETQELAARRSAYDSDMKLAQQALAANNLGYSQMLLNRHKLQSGQPDLRGWEWRYLWTQARADEHEVVSTPGRFSTPLSFSGDGRLLARDVDGNLVVTDLISHQTVMQRTDVWQSVFAHHDALLAFVEANSTNEAVTLLDMATHKESRLETSLPSIQWLEFTPDDRRLLTVSSRPANGLPFVLTIWEADTGKQIWRRAIGAINDNNPGTVLSSRSVAISPDGSAIATVLPTGRVQVLETKDGTVRFNIKTTQERAMAVAFSPDSSTLVTGAAFTDSTIRLWDAHNGQATGSLEGHGTWVSDLLFTPDGTRLISSSGDETIRVWDWATRKTAEVLRGHVREIDGLAMAPDGRTLASHGSDGSIYLWDLTKPPSHLGYQIIPTPLNSAVFTPDSQSILSLRSTGLTLWDPHTLKEMRPIWVNSTNLYGIISPDAKWVVRTDNGGRLSVGDARSGLEVTNFVAAPGQFDAWFTANGKFLATLSGPVTNLVLQAWETGTWQRRGSVSLHFKNVWRIFTPSLPNSYVIEADQALHFFDVSKLNEAPKLIEFPRFIGALATSPEFQLAAGTDKDGNVRLWDLATLKPLEPLTGFLIGVNAVAFSPDGWRLAAGSGGQEAVKLWDTETRQEVLTLSATGYFGGLLTFSPDGRYLLAFNGRGLAHLWFAPTLAEIEAAEKSATTPSPQQQNQAKP